MSYWKWLYKIIMENREGIIFVLMLTAVPCILTYLIISIIGSILSNPIAFVLALVIGTTYCILIVGYQVYKTEEG